MAITFYNHRAGNWHWISMISWPISLSNFSSFPTNVFYSKRKKIFWISCFRIQFRGTLHLVSMSFHLLSLEEFLSLSLSLMTFTFLKTEHSFCQMSLNLDLSGCSPIITLSCPFGAEVAQGRYCVLFRALYHEEGRVSAFPHHCCHCAGDLHKVASGFSTFVKLLLSFSIYLVKEIDPYPGYFNIIW